MNAVSGKPAASAAKTLRSAAMKKLLLFCLILSITFLYVAVVFADEAAKSETVNGWVSDSQRSEEHTSELQSPCNLVCRLLLEKKNTPTAHDSRSYSRAFTLHEGAG